MSEAYEHDRHDSGQGLGQRLRRRPVRSFRVVPRFYVLTCCGCGDESEWRAVRTSTGHVIDANLEEVRRWAREDGYMHVSGEGWYCPECWERAKAEALAQGLAQRPGRRMEGG